jgi:hypothetical protein
VRRSGSLLVRVALAVAVLTALAPSAASAAFTSSTVTAPADRTALISDDQAPGSFHVTGKVSPPAPSTTADLICLSNPSAGWFSLLASDVPTDPTTGAFAADVPKKDVLGSVCRIHAINDAASPPPNMTPFSGPRIAGSGRKSFHMSSGANVGRLYDFYVASTRFSAGNDFASIGNCGHDDSYLYSSAPTLTEVFFCNSWIAAEGASNTASLRIDGHPSWASAGIADGGYFSGFSDRKPFPTLSYSYHLDPSTRDLVIGETDHLVRCSPQPDVYPPTAASCTSFVDAGAKVERTILADHGQQLVRIRDRWSSTTGHAHPFAVQYKNDQCLGYSGSCSLHVAYRFPGQTTYATHGVGDTVNGPFPAPASILVKDTTAPDGDPGRGQGATTYSVAPDRATFVNAVPNDYVLSYSNRTIPATGSLDFQFADSTALTTAAVLSLARVPEDQYSPPRVTIAKPRDGSYSAARTTRVRGTATDNVGVASLKLNGKALKRGAGGAFSRRVGLHAGRNAFTVVARDAAGATGRARTTVVELLARTGKPRAGKRVVDAGLALACPAAGPSCTAKLVAKAKLRKGGHARPVGSATVKVRPGKRHELTAKLTRRARRALAAHRRLRIALGVRVRVGAAATARTTRSFSVKR